MIKSQSSKYIKLLNADVPNRTSKYRWEKNDKTEKRNRNIHHYSQRHQYPPSVDGSIQHSFA